MKTYYYANNFPVPILIQDSPRKANLSSFDDNFYAISEYLANVANMQHGSGSLIISDVPPPINDLVAGSLWWDSSRGNLKVYFQNGDVYQWVESAVPPSGGISQASITYIENAVATAQQAMAGTLTNINATYNTYLQGSIQGIQEIVNSKADIWDINLAIADASQSITYNYEQYVSNYVLQHPSSQGTIIDLSSYATIYYVNTTVTNAQEAVAQQINGLESDFYTYQTGVQGVQYLITSAQATISELNQTVATAQGAIATSLNTLSADFSTLQVSVQGVQTVTQSKASMFDLTNAIATAQGAISEEYKSYVASYVTQNATQGLDLSSYATVSYVTGAIAGAGYAQASTLTTVQSTLAGQQTSVSALTSSVNGVTARYGVTIDNNGAISGFQLLSGTGGVSEFSVNADYFKVYRATGGNTAIFTVDGVTNKVKFTSNVDISGAVTVSSMSDALNGSTSGSAKITLDASNGGRIIIYDSSSVQRVVLGYLG